MASSPEFQRWKAAARAAPIGDVIDARHIRLRGSSERVGACPNCGYGKHGPGASDRFSVNPSKNVWRCRGCAPDGGDVIQLVMFLDGCDFLTACQQLVGQPPPDGKSRPLDLKALAVLEAARAERAAAAEAERNVWREREINTARRFWLSAEKNLPGTEVEDYLALRRVSLPPKTYLRFHPQAKLWAEDKDETGKRPLLHVGPCMFAGIIGRDGLFYGLHMTWIDLSDPDGKARRFDPTTGEFAPVKKIRGGHKGGYIDLSRTVSPLALVIGEGIETVLSVRDEMIEAGQDITRTAFWSAINLGNLGGPALKTVAHPFLRTDKNRPVRVQGADPKGGAEAGIPIPESVREILLLGDGDSDRFTTGLHLERAANRWAMPGRTIRAAWAPDKLDFNSARRRYLESLEAA